MLQLLGAGVIRDGGSISMEYRKEDGSLVSVLLEVNRTRDGEPRTFGHLHVGSDIQNRCDTSTIVQKGSGREALLKADIEELLRGAHHQARSESMHWLKQLQKQLSARTS